MRFQINAIFALHTRQGLVFGCVTEVDGEKIQLQAPCKLAAGEMLDWRMQLVGRREMVTGSLRIDALIDASPGESPTYDARILAMSDENRATWQSWLVERTSSSASDGRGSPRPETPAPAPRATNETVHLSVEGRFKDGPSSEPPNAALAGRVAITAALKASLSKANRVRLPQQRAGQLSATREPTDPGPMAAPVTELRIGPPRPPVSATAPEMRNPPPAPSRSKIPADNPPAPPRQPAVSADPAIAIRAGAVPIQMLLRYRAQSAYAQDYSRFLSGSGAFVPVVEIEPLRQRGARVRVRIELPSGAWLICNGEVVAPMSDGVGLALELSPDQKKLLAQEASR